MMKEHILQFGVSIDEDAIIKKVEESASKKVIDSIDGSLKGLTESYSYGSPSRLYQIAKQEVKVLVDAHQEEIISGAIKELALSLSRKKVVKEKLEGLIEKMLDQMES